jgi:hypothetical protein
LKSRRPTRDLSTSTAIVPKPISEVNPVFSIRGLCEALFKRVRISF